LKGFIFKAEFLEWFREGFFSSFKVILALRLFLELLEILETDLSDSIP
jgi:hypothetical protein